MSSNQTTTPTLPELHIDDGEFEQPGIGPAMRAYIKRMYAGYYNIIWTEKNPHLNFVGTRFSEPVHVSRKLLRDKRSLVIFWTPEPVRITHKLADHSLSFYHDTATNTWFPDMLTILYEDFVGFLSNKPTQRVLTNRQTPKPNFCAFIHVWNDPKLSQTKVRREFCAELMKYKKVLCPGQVMNNVQAPDYMILKNATKDFSVGLIRYLAECKFFICFENQLSSKQEPDGLRFVTQKILSAFIAGSIPIYSGYREIAELFNPAAFINAADFSTHQELIEYIKEVDNSPELTAAYRNARPILPDSPLHNLHPDKMRPIFLSLAERALERATKPPIFQPYYLRRRYYYNMMRFKGRFPRIAKVLF